MERKLGERGEAGDAEAEEKRFEGQGLSGSGEGKAVQLETNDPVFEAIEDAVPGVGTVRLGARDQVPGVPLERPVEPVDPVPGVVAVPWFPVQGVELEFHAEGEGFHGVGPETVQAFPG